MPSPLAAAGAASEPSQYAPLTMDRYITGIWTQRSPLRDADVPYLYGKFYSASRFDSIIDGINREITAKLTLARRPGNSIYNSQNFLPVGRFYSFKTVEDGTPRARVMVDTATGVYDGTGPNTKTLIFVKSTGAGKTSFQSVGNTLYMANGVDNVKWVLSSLVWKANTSFAQGNFIVDPTNSLQLAIGPQTASIQSVQVAGGVLTVFFDPQTSLDVPLATEITFAGLTTATFLNGLTLPVSAVPNGSQIQAAISHADYADTADTGTATTGNGITGGAVPAWSDQPGAVTADGGAQWVCRGSSVQKWGLDTPLTAPTVTQVPAPSIYPAWEANTHYSPSFLIVDPNVNIQFLTTAGVTGSAIPTFNPTVGGTTADGTAVWTNQGSAARVPSTAVAVGGRIAVDYTYYITQKTTTFVNGRWQTTYRSIPVLASDFFTCIKAGVTSAGSSATIGWAAGLGTTTNDGTVIWSNAGNQITWASFGAAASLSLASQILDSNGNLQSTQTPGLSGAAAPTWEKAQGSYTFDNGMSWLNAGPFSSANTGAWIYAYSFGNSLTGHVGTASALSLPIIVAQDNQGVIQGSGNSDGQDDTIYLWRTEQGGSILLLLDTIPNPGAGQTWIYTDTTQDSGLNAEITAPINGVNNPPPAGLTALSYHLNRIWGFVGVNLYSSTGPDVTVGSGNEAWAPINVDVFPEAMTRSVPFTVSNGGLLCMGSANIYVLLGTGTASNPFYSTLFMGKVGLLSWDALDVVGSTLYFLTNNLKQVSLDPSAGYVETGFPIGDQFQEVTTGGITAALYNPQNAFVSWYEKGSPDSGIFVADGAVGWFRYSPVASPESGFLWSPRAAIEGGTSAVSSVETAIGTLNLLIGPSANGPILMRDTSTHQDNGVSYTNCYATMGNIVLCESGEVAEVAHIALDSMRVGERPTVGLLLGEIYATPEVGFDMLDWTSVDPPDLPESQTLYSDRYTALQNGVCPKCRHLQILIQWPVQNVPDELLTHTIYGAKYGERREQ